MRDASMSLPTLLVATATAATASPASVPSPAEAEVQLRAIDSRIVDACSIRSPAQCEALVDRDFLFIDIEGAWLERDAFLARPRLADIAREAVQVRLFGEVAVLHGTFHNDNAHVRYTHAYAWRGGQWRLVNAQDTPIKAGMDANEDVATAPIVARPWQGVDPAGDDIAALTALNAQYVQAFRDADVAWYDAHLAPDYRVVFGDGSIHDRAAALADFAKPYFAEGIAAFPLDQVRVRRFGDAALIHAENAYTLKDGRKGVNRYTDIWVKRAGRWWCVAAHITVHAPPR